MAPRSRIADVSRADAARGPMVRAVAEMLGGDVTALATGWDAHLDGNPLLEFAVRKEVLFEGGCKARCGNLCSNCAVGSPLGAERQVPGSSQLAPDRRSWGGLAPLHGAVNRHSALETTDNSRR